MKFFAIVNDPALSADNLNHDLRLIQQWAYKWNMEFNPDPSKQAKVNSIFLQEIIT